MDTKKVQGFTSVLGNGKDQTVEIPSAQGAPEEYPLGVVVDVFAAEEHYIVYTDPNDVLWYVADSTLKDPDRQFNLIWSRVQEVKSLPMDNSQRKSVLAALAAAVGYAFQKDYDSAGRAVDQAYSTLHSASLRKATACYTTTATIIGLATASIGLFWYFTCIDRGESNSELLFQVLMASLAGGSVGALLSALGPRGGKPTIDPFATPQEAAVDGAIRIVFGVISAFIVTLAVQVQFVTSSLLTNDDTNLSLLIVAVAGGFLERWAIDIIRKVRPADPAGPPPEKVDQSSGAT